ncbi:tripartite motif-containing protein 12A-like [Branchiostoma lanceolatum]|uniref:tripartite motif-containing protein 12A-like n=1 Tax=Branchiostoma lanceolatum TaxID=7740 RepID=UPI0034566EFF
MLSMESTRIQKDMEDRFNCPICLSPRLKMVVGLCQHRVCDSCLYEDSGKLSLTVCPVCQEEGCFPKTRPIIPEDSILAQRRLGVVTCLNDGCEEEMWEWELHEHQR